jgi:hypothetical protein
MVPSNQDVVELEVSSNPTKQGSPNGFLAVEGARTQKQNSWGFGPPSI